MASLDQMKAAAASQGATAPADYPGGPDQWVQDWYANAKAAGSVREPGPTRVTEDNVTVSDWTQAAPSSAWMGQRMPTVEEMRKWGTEQHAAYLAGNRSAQDEDWSRFSDAQLQAWIQEGWDPTKGGWKEGKGAHGDADCPEGTTFHGSKCVPWSQLPPELGGTLGMPAGSKPAGAAGGGASTPQGNYDPNNPLQARLMELMQSGGGPMGGINAGGFTGGGGAMWTTPTPGSAAPAPAAAGGGVATIAPALIQGTLNAFTPNAPSAQAASGGQAATSATQAFQPVQPQVQAAVQPWQPATQQQPLNQALQSKQMQDPNAWWKGSRIKEA